MWILSKLKKFEMRFLGASIFIIGAILLAQFPGKIFNSIHNFPNGICECFLELDFLSFFYFSRLYCNRINWYIAETKLRVWGFRLQSLWKDCRFLNQTCKSGVEACMQTVAVSSFFDGIHMWKVRWKTWQAIRRMD